MTQTSYLFYKLQTYSNQNPPRKLILITILILHIVLTSIPPKIDLQHSTSQIIYYLQDKMATQNIEQIFQAETYINQGIEYVQNPGQTCNLLLGMARSGKSTLLNYLLGKKLIVEKESRKFKVRLEDQWKIGQATIAYHIHNTNILKKYQSNQGAFKQTLFDNPGFGDNRGVATDISNALLISELLKTAQNIRFILTLDIDNITGDNVDLYISLIKTITHFFNIQNIKDHTCIVFTKVEEDYQDEDILADLELKTKQITDPGFDKELIRYLIQSKRIFFFRVPNVRGPLSNQNAQLISKNILSIEPLQKINLSKVKITVSSETKKYFYQNTGILLQLTMKNLRKFLHQLYQTLHLSRIQTSQQGRDILSKFTEFFDKQIRGKSSVRHMLTRLLELIKQKNIQISDQKILDTINSKICLIDFIQKQLQINTRQIYSDIQTHISNIQKQLNQKILSLLVKELMIQKQTTRRKLNQLQQINKLLIKNIQSVLKNQNQYQKYLMLEQQVEIIKINNQGKSNE